MIISEKLFNRLVLGAVMLGFLALVIAGIAAAWSVKRNQDFTGLVNHTYDVQQKISDLRAQTERSETARRGFILSRDPVMDQTFQTVRKTIPQTVGALRKLTADNPRQQTRLDRLDTLLSRQMELINTSMGQARSGHVAEATRSFTEDGSIELTREVRNLTQEMAGEEGRLLAQRNTVQQASAKALLYILVAAAVLMAAVGIGSVWVIMQYTQDLSASREAVRQANTGLESAVDERTSELRMANDEIQRFAYIVSHDLRSPLVNVMGFTAELEAAVKPLKAMIEAVQAEKPELISREAKDAVNLDLPESLGFIRSSTRKMDNLINAILKLSREGRRVIAPETLDMRTLLAGVADNVRHRADERDATVEIDPRVPDITSDRFAIEQIFSNLVDNAVKYLAPGRPGLIKVSGRIEHGRAIFEVSDNGRGIDPRDHSRVFDLFRRSGAQDQPGEGIGLAHVRALTYRLGGLISCESSLDQGATFRLSLPTRLTLQNSES